jgi:hypothetical protein
MKEAIKKRAASHHDPSKVTSHEIIRSTSMTDKLDSTAAKRR